MSITDNYEVWRGETLSDTVDGARSYTRKFEIWSDDPNESWSVIRAALPTGAHPDDASAYVKSRSVSRSDESRLKWEADINYEYSPKETGDNPTARAAKVRWTSSLVVKPIMRDLNGDACVNSAGDYFDPPLEAEVPRWTATIQFNAASVPVGILSYAGAVNNAGITIDGVAIAAKRARVLSLDIGEEDEENGYAFRSVTLAVECRYADDDGFDLEPLDQGFRITISGALTDILIPDEDGATARPSSPVLLDGTGNKLTSPGPGTAVFLNFAVTRKLDLTVFTGIT